MASVVRRGSMAYISDRINGKTVKTATGCLFADKIGREIKLREYVQTYEKTGCRPKRLVKFTLQQHIDAFYEHQLAQQLTEKQASGNRMRVTRLCQLARITSIEAVTETRIQGALAKLRCQTMSPKSRPEEMPLVSPRTRNIYLKSFKTFFNWLVRNDDLSKSPIQSIRCENEEVDVRHPRTAYTDQEFVKLYRAAQSSTRIVEGFTGPTRALAYLLSAYSGLRKSELGSLTASSFQLEKDEPHITVEAACSKRRRQDTLPLASHIIADVQQAIADLTPNAHLFPRLKFRKTHKMIQVDLAAAGIKYQTPNGAYRDWHALRHTFVTRAWRTGAAPNVIKELARHSDFRLTMRYSHTVSRELQDAVNAIPNLLGEG